MWVLRISFGVGQQRQSLTAWTSACGSKLDYPDVIGARDGARLHLEGSPKLLEDFGFYGRILQSVMHIKIPNSYINHKQNT